MKIPKIRKKRSLIIALACFLGAFVLQGLQNLPENKDAKIVSVYDGDTFRAKIEGIEGISKIRIKNIDCFERKSPQAKKQVKRQMQRFQISELEVYQNGDKAKQILEDLFTQAKTIRLKVNPHKLRDVYKRVLAEVFVDDINVESILLASGVCFVYKDPRKYKKN